MLAFESDSVDRKVLSFSRNNIFAVVSAYICRELKLLDNFSNRVLLLINELLIKMSCNYFSTNTGKIHIHYISPKALIVNRVP